MGQFLKITLVCSPGSYLMLCIFLLLVPVPWIGAWILASVFHECCHLICLTLLKVPIREIRITVLGAQIETGNLSPFQDILSAAAGPAGSLLLFLLLSGFPRLALCGLFQGTYNLLPLFPLDGGRVLRVVLQSTLKSQTALVTEQIIRWFALILLGIGAAYLHIHYRMGIAPYVFLIILGIKTGKGTFPCKHSLHLLQ